MYRAIQQIGIKDFLVAEAPTLVVSLVAAEIFYKFGSFLLETAAFLATWYILSVLQSTLRVGRFETKP